MSPYATLKQAENKLSIHPNIMMTSLEEDIRILQILFIHLFCSHQIEILQFLNNKYNIICNNRWCSTNFIYLFTKLSDNKTNKFATFCVKFT